MIWLIELTVFSPAAVGTRTWRWATTPGLQTRPSETPANAVYQARVVDPGNVEEHLFSRGLTRGRSVLGKGEIRLNNKDGGLDGLAADIWDGGDLVVRYGPAGGRYPTDFPPVSTGKCRRVRFDVDAGECVLGWSDGQAGVLDKYVWREKFGGTNSLPNGVDGTADDLRGKPIPLLMGNPGKRVAPPLVNTSRYIYQVSRRQVASITDIRDGGAAYTVGVTRASLAALESNTPAAGAADIYLGSATDGAYIRVPSRPSRTLTCDAVEGAAGQRTLARVAERTLLLSGELTADRIDRASFDAAHSLEPAEVGYWVGPEDGETRVGDVLDALTDGAGAWLLPNPTGVWSVGFVGVPAGNPVKRFDRFNIGRGFTLEFNADTDGVPASSITVRYARNLTVAQPGDLAGSAPDDLVAYAGAEYRQVTVPRTSQQPFYATAKELVLTTALTATADATRRAQRARDFYCALRPVVSIPCAISEAVGVRRGVTIEVAYGRFPDLGFAAGRLMTVIGTVHRRREGQAVIYAVG